MMEGSTSAYTAMVLQGGQPQPHANPTEDNNNEDHDLGPASGPKVHSSIELAKTPGVFFCFLLLPSG
jgi:hypothetical protein